MKKLFLTLLLALTVLALAAAGGSQENAAQEPAEIVIRWAYWGSGARVTISQEAIDLYESRNPGIRVNPEVSGVV